MDVIEFPEDKNKNRCDIIDPFEIVPISMRSLHKDIIIKWFISKYPDIENPLLKRYPEDDERTKGDGIFIDEEDFIRHYNYQCVLSDMIQSFAKDVMIVVDPKFCVESSDMNFHINSKFILKNTFFVKQFLDFIISKQMC